MTKKLRESTKTFVLKVLKDRTDLKEFQIIEHIIASSASFILVFPSARFASKILVIFNSFYSHGATLVINGLTGSSSLTAASSTTCVEGTLRSRAFVPPPTSYAYI